MNNYLKIVCKCNRYVKVNLKLLKIILYWLPPIVFIVYLTFEVCLVYPVFVGDREVFVGNI